MYHGCATAISQTEASLSTSEAPSSVPHEPTAATEATSTRRGERPSWPTLKRLLRSYILPLWRVALAATVATLIYAVTEAGFVAVIRPLLDEGLVERHADTIRFYAALVMGLLVAQSLAFFTSQYLTGWLKRQIIKQLRRDVHNHLLALPNRAFDRLSSGRMVSRLTYEAEQTSRATAGTLLTALRDSVTVILVISYLTYLSPWLMLITSLVLPLIAGLMAYINRRFRKISRRVHNAVSGVGSVTEESVRAQAEVKLFGQQEHQRHRYEQLNERNRRQSMKFAVTRFASVPIMRLVIALALALVINIATVDTIVQTLTPGTLASFVGAMLLLNQPLKNLVKVNAKLQRGLTAAHHIFEILDTPPERDTGTKPIERAQGAIAFDRVCFSYDSRQEVLRAVDLRVEPGEMLALTGPSGSGKTTLVSLLPRFYDPTAGEIRLDGSPLPAYRLTDLRRQFALVMQDTMLFNTTIAENIAFGTEGDAGREAIEHAAEVAYARDFIERLPRGLDTQVGEDGAQLSGGQRQRIAIARAVLKDAPILILDEATAALDTESERHIHAAFERLMADRTVFVIAHRLSTVERADQIVFLEQGQVVERGTHRELIAQDGRYAGLYRMQYAPAAEEGQS